jgi:hypothetical protein
VEDAMLQLQIELQVVQSRLRSDAAGIGGYTFESYEDTLKWVTANCSVEDWQYVMDMPALYSPVQPGVWGWKKSLIRVKLGMHHPLKID